MVDLLDEVIQANHLPWGYAGADAASETGRWTLAGAMALKCKILQFAASPLFNDSKSYFDGRYTLEDPLVAWYGGYDAERWNRFKKACEDFLQQMNAKGIYHLVVPAGKTTGYRLAFRSSCLSKEVRGDHGHPSGKNAYGNDYGWINLCIPHIYCPHRNASKCSLGRTDVLSTGRRQTGKLDHMFVGRHNGNNQMLQNRKYTRDPRLYETVAVNGALQAINWGTEIQAVQTTNSGLEEPLRVKPHTSHWNRLPIPEILCRDAFLRKYPNDLAQSRRNLPWICRSPCPDRKQCESDRICRRHAGESDWEVWWNATPTEPALRQECAVGRDHVKGLEFAFNDSRYFDMIRYKRADLFERPLHRLLITDW